MLRVESQIAIKLFKIPIFIYSETKLQNSWKYRKDNDFLFEICKRNLPTQCSITPKYFCECDVQNKGPQDFRS